MTVRWSTAPSAPASSCSASARSTSGGCAAWISARSRSTWSLAPSTIPISSARLSALRRSLTAACETSSSSRRASSIRLASSFSAIALVAVRVADVAPSAEVEKALRQPTREAIQQRADEATFQRRAMAVEKERAIAENELANRIELARREEELVSQASVNDRRTAESRAEEIALVEGAKLQVERERAEIQAALPPEVLRALALQELAGALGTVEHLTVTPDLLAPLLAKAA